MTLSTTRLAMLSVLAIGLLPAASGKEKGKMHTPKLQDHFAEVNGIRLHYVSAGKGPLILFLHGFPEFWYAWKGQLAEFGRDHLAVAPDMRGYNLSDKPADVDQYKVSLLVEDIHALAEHLGHKKFILGEKKNIPPNNYGC